MTISKAEAGKILADLEKRAERRVAYRGTGLQAGDLRSVTEPGWWFARGSGALKRAKAAARKGLAGQVFRVQTESGAAYSVTALGRGRVVVTEGE